MLDVEYGKMGHGKLAKLGFDSFEVVGDALVEFYSGFGEFELKVIDDWETHVRVHLFVASSTHQLAFCGAFCFEPAR